MKPPFAWYGGKSGLAALLAGELPPHQTYVEPFGGSAALLFAKPRSRREIVNDINPICANLLRVIRDQPAHLASAVPDRPTKQDWFTAQTAVWNATPGAAGALSTAQQARLAASAKVRYRTADEADPLPLAAATFTACNGAFNSRLYGGQIGDTWPSLKMLASMPKRKALIAAAAERLAGVEIEQRDGLEMIAEHAMDPDALLFIDPPYLYAEDGGGSRTKRTTYGPGEPPDLDWHRQLLGQICFPSRARMLITSGDDGLYREKLAGWRLVERIGKTWMNARHLIWANYDARAVSARAAGGGG